jgi:hypothetical protein
LYHTEIQGGGESDGRHVEGLGGERKTQGLLSRSRSPVDMVVLIDRLQTVGYRWNGNDLSNGYGKLVHYDKGVKQGTKLCKRTDIIIKYYKLTLTKICGLNKVNGSTAQRTSFI